jgi:hypothetical protein
VQFGLLAAGGLVFAAAWRASRPMSAARPWDGLAFLLLAAWTFVLVGFMEPGTLAALVEAHEYALAGPETPLAVLAHRLPSYIVLVALIAAPLAWLSIPLPLRTQPDRPLSAWLAPRFGLPLLAVWFLASTVATHLLPLLDTGYCAAEGGLDLLRGTAGFYDAAASPSGICSGRAYGVVTYLATIPAHLLGALAGFPVLGEDTFPPSAAVPDHRQIVFAFRATQVAFTAGTLWGLHRIGQGGGRGLALCLAWLSFPVVVASQGMNDVVAICIVVLALAYRDRPWLCGALIGLAVHAKFLPVVLVPLLVVHFAGRDRRAFAAGLAGALALPMAFLAVRGESGSYVGSVLARMGSGIDLSFWWLFGLGEARRVPVVAVLASSLLPLWFFRKRRAGFDDVLRYGASILFALMFFHNCPHPGLVALPVTLALVARFRGAPDGT